MKKLFIAFFFLSGFSGYSQFFPVDTAGLNNMYRLYISDPDKYENQLAFLYALPSTFEEFSYTYAYFNEETGYDRTMYFKANDHILEGLIKLDLIEDSTYCDKIIKMSLKGQWNVDAPNYLQMTLRLAMKNRKEEMFKRLNDMMEGQQVSFWFFYYHDRFKSKESEFNELKSEMRSKYPNVVHSMEIAYPAAAGMVWY